MKEKIRANNEMFLLEQTVRKLEFEKQKEQARLKQIQDEEQKSIYYHERKMRDLVFQQQRKKENDLNDELTRKQNYKLHMQRRQNVIQARSSWQLENLKKK